MVSMTHWFRSWRGMVVAAAAGAVLAIGLVGWAASRSTESAKPLVAAWLMVELPPLKGGVEGQADQHLRLASYRQTQANLIVSPNVLDAAARELGLKHPQLTAGKADPVAWLQAGIKVENLSDALLAISMPGESRADQAVLVNVVVNAYLAATSDWERGQQKSRIENGQTILTNYRQILFAKRRSLRDTAPTEPEQAAALRDEIAILEELTHRLGVAAEQGLMETSSGPTVRLIARARP